MRELGRAWDANPQHARQLAIEAGFIGGRSFWPTAWT